MDDAGRREVGVLGCILVSTSKPALTVAEQIASELGVRTAQVTATVDLLDAGATVPFVARYRKEATGGLDDVQLRSLEERLRYLRELEERRAAILESIEGQGKLDDAVRERIRTADSKARLEDIYLPFKQKRRTKAQLAREAGLEPLADRLLADPTLEPAAAAATFVAEGYPDPAAALDGARAILIERYAEDADLIGELRERLWSQGRLTSTVRAGREDDGSKFADYFAFSEPLPRLPSHRILAVFRGEKEEVLQLSVEPEETSEGRTEYEKRISARFGIRDAGRPADRWLLDTVRWAWRTRIYDRLAMDLRGRLRQAAEDEAVRVFAENLRDLLLAAPAGTRPTMGLDPGLRTGVKVAVVDGTGRVVATDTIYPHPPHRKWRESLATLTRLATEHRVELIAIGNGTASRETDKLAAELLAAEPSLSLTKAVVSEAGASVYSASAYASAELPDLDVSIRGAVSIARRLQDPLAELVKIEPKSIGVGQYQHDLPELSLSRSLDAVVEDCVNAVGVDLNTASVPLLARVSGIGTGLAGSIVAHRDSHGGFRSRAGLRDVRGLGPKAFQLSAGFLRIRDGDDPLDASGVHPESYPVVRRIVARTKTELTDLVGNSALLRSLQPADFVDDRFGLPTVTDILSELDKPGRDPRPAFRTARFADGVEQLTDLRPGMVLEGTVTNVAAFGAFVDVGVHQNGLVHISALSNRFVADPREVVKPGDIVRVKVLEIDIARKRIGLTLRLNDEPQRSGAGSDARPANTGAGERGSRGRDRDRPGRPNRPRPAGGRGSSGAEGSDSATPRADDRRRRAEAPSGSMAKPCAERDWEANGPPRGRPTRAAADLDGGSRWGPNQAFGRAGAHCGRQHQHGRGHSERGPVAGGVGQEAGGQRTDQAANVAGHLEAGDHGAPAASDDVAEHRARGHVEQSATGAEDQHGRQEKRQGRVEHQHRATGRAAQAAGQQDRLATPAVGQPAAHQQRRDVADGEDGEPDPGPDRRAVQHLDDQQGHDRGPDAQRGPVIGQVGQRRRLEGRDPKRLGHGQRRALLVRPPLARRGPARQQGKTDRPGRGQGPGVEEERCSQRPAGDQATQARAGDAADQEPPAEGAHRASTLVRRRDPEQQRTRRYREHRRTDPASTAQHQQLDVVVGEAGQRAADRDDADAGAEHDPLTDPVHQPADSEGGGQPHEGESAHHRGRRGPRHPEAAREHRDRGRDDAEAGRDEEGHRGQHPHLDRQVPQRAARDHPTLDRAFGVTSARGHPALSGGRTDRGFRPEVRG